MSLFGNIEKLITEHGSAAVLRERIALAQEKHEALEKKLADLKEDHAKELKQLRAAHATEIEALRARLAPAKHRPKARRRARKSR